MATYVGITLDISGMLSLKVGSYTPVTFPPDPFIYSFTLYSNVIKLIVTDIIDLSTLKLGFLMPSTGYGDFIAYNSRKEEISDLPDLSNLKIGFLMSPTGFYYQNMGVRIYFKNFSLGYGGVDLF